MQLSGLCLRLNIYHPSIICTVIMASPLPFLLCLCCQVLSATVVTHLPGYSGPLPFYLETGYVGVDEVNDVQLFYYFIESEGTPREDPVLLWLTGGPGCSAFSGLAFEIEFAYRGLRMHLGDVKEGDQVERRMKHTGISQQGQGRQYRGGPLNFRKEKFNGSLPSLVYNPYSWTKVSNVIFLDSPVGTGFSYSGRSEDYEVGDTVFSRHVHTFLLKWFTDHPQFLANHLYIAGDSYAGKVIPVIAEEISEGTENGDQPALNLKGYLVGNPVTGEKIDVDAQVPYLHGVGIISDELYETAIRSCGKDLQSTNYAECANVLNVVQEFISEINKDHILEPKCSFALTRPKNRRLVTEDNNELCAPPSIPDIKCRSYAYFLSYYWANNNMTRAALNIQKGSIREWQRCNYDLPYTHDIPSSLKYHLNLTRKGYRALVYSGDHDAYVPFLGTQAWIRSLNFSIVDDWRSWRVSGQVAGYTQTYANNLTFATVKGAGHTAPEYCPKECLAMLRRWISRKPL